MTATQLELFPAAGPHDQDSTPGAAGLADSLRRFHEFGELTREEPVALPGGGSIPGFLNEFWTSKQRAASSLHEISYRACFKPQLPRFFLDRLTVPGGVVYDPFMGRGTTVVEAALRGRRPVGCDVNPLSRILVEPRLAPPSLAQVADRLERLCLDTSEKAPEDLLVFYHEDTLRQILALRSYFLEREAEGRLDAVDRWLRMVAVNRLTGHSPGFFSVYTMPPNQAVSVQAQRKINERRGQTPPRRDVADLILRKSRSLLADCTRDVLLTLQDAARDALLLTGDNRSTPAIPSGSVDLVVTSPPFVDIVDYAGDNWLRCWFCGIDARQVPITVVRGASDWVAAMAATLAEVRRVLRVGGHVAFEVGEVRGGSRVLERGAIAAGIEAGLEPVLVLLNQQQFTKTANCWGVSNNSKGTNTNRVVLMRKRD